MAKFFLSGLAVVSLAMCSMQCVHVDQHCLAHLEQIQREKHDLERLLASLQFELISTAADQNGALQWV